MRSARASSKHIHHVEDLYHLEDFVVQTPGRMEAPLLDVVTVREGEASTSIN